PRVEDIGGFGCRETETAPEDVEDLGDELHVAVLDAVVHHFDEVAGAVRADVRHARAGFGPGRDRVEHVADAVPRLVRAARHQRRAVPRSFLAAGDAAADEMDVLLAERGLAPAGVLEMRVPAVDEDVAGIDERGELPDRLIDGSTRGDHHHDPPRTLQIGHQFLQGRRAGEPRVPMVLEERGGPLRLEVPHGDGKAVRFDVEREVAAHRAQADHAERAAAHARISSAAASARSKAVSRARTPSSSEISTLNALSPSGTTRETGAMFPPRTEASRHV